VIFLLYVLLFAAASGPIQPIPYSHKQHLALGLKCKECHSMPDPGEIMGISDASRCMTCHVSIKKDSPAIQKLAAFASVGRPVPWIRVYQIPSYVEFSHKAHLDAGASCETCHGPVAERDRMAREVDISMTGCMNCHRANKATLACTSCHEERK
jgi:Cytochrome c7 and related cytochrome c